VFYSLTLGYIHNAELLSSHKPFKSAESQYSKERPEEERPYGPSTLLRLSGRYLTWCFICWTTFSLSDSPSDAHVALASSCCRLSVLSDVISGRDDAAGDVMSIASMLSSSQSDVLVPVDSRLIKHRRLK